MSQNSFQRQCDVLIFISLVYSVAILKIPLDPPLKKGEDVVLPFYKGELEGIFSTIFVN